VLQDFLRVFSEHRERAPELYYIRRFYQIPEWNPERYHALLEEFEKHLDLIHDLVFELTRAANYVCDAVRSSIVPSYRVEHGVLLIERMEGVFEVKVFRPEYRGDERTDVPYLGLDRFVYNRFGRDFTSRRSRATQATHNNRTKLARREAPRESNVGAAPRSFM
jgi:hypothetical protein